MKESRAGVHFGRLSARFCESCKAPNLSNEPFVNLFDVVALRQLDGTQSTLVQ